MRLELPRRVTALYRMDCLRAVLGEAWVHNVQVLTIANDIPNSLSGSRASRSPGPKAASRLELELLWLERVERLLWLLNEELLVKLAAVLLLDVLWLWCVELESSATDWELVESAAVELLLLLDCEDGCAAVLLLL